MVGGRVVHDEVGDDAHTALMGLIDEALEIVHEPVVGMDREEVGDVVAPVAQWRLVHRQEPDAVDAEPLQVVELLDQAAEVAGAVVVAVEEAADVDLVEDRGLEPKRVPLEPVAWLRHLSISDMSRGQTRGHGRTGPVPGTVPGAWPLRSCPRVPDGELTHAPAP